MVLKFKVSEQTITSLATKSIPRRGSAEYLDLEFSFSPDWNDLDKILYFQSGEYSTPVELASEQTSVRVPPYYTQQESFIVTLLGTSSSTEVPTNVVAIELQESNELWIADAPIPEPNWLTAIKELSANPPKPGENGFWLLWDTETHQYVESDILLTSAVEVDQSYDQSSENAQSGKAVNEAITGIKSQIEYNVDLKIEEVNGKITNLEGWCAQNTALGQSALETANMANEKVTKLEQSIGDIHVEAAFYDLDNRLSNQESTLGDIGGKVIELDKSVGDIDKALDDIIELQESFMLEGAEEVGF